MTGNKEEPYPHKNAVFNKDLRFKGKKMTQNMTVCSEIMFKTLKYKSKWCTISLNNYTNRAFFVCSF